MMKEMSSHHDAMTARVLGFRREFHRAESVDADDSVTPAMHSRDPAMAQVSALAAEALWTILIDHVIEDERSQAERDGRKGLGGCSIGWERWTGRS
jgi:hypothetical protein